MMKKMLLPVFPLFISTIGLFAQEAKEEKKWAVPNIAYRCEAHVGQDWSKGRPGKSAVYAKTKESFLVRMRGGSVNLEPKDFVIRDDSELKSFEDSDLKEFYFDIGINATGENGATLSVTAGFNTETLGRTAHITSADRRAGGSGVPHELAVDIELRAGDREDIMKKSGPILSNVHCTLASLF